MTEREVLADLVGRMAEGTTTAADASWVEFLLRENEELVEGARRLAKDALAALEKGTWQVTRQKLELLTRIG